MPPHPRIATTHELMLPYAADLLRQKAKGASHGQMISWLHTQGVMVNMGEIASFWPYLAIQKQKPPQPPIPPANAPLSAKNSQQKADNYQPSASSFPSFPSVQKTASCAPASGTVRNPTPNNNTGSAEKPNQPNEEKRPPMASGGLTARAPDLHSMMEKYQRILDKQIDKVEADPDPDPEKLKIIDRMMRTVQVYDRAQERKEERKEALELKKAGHELNVKKAAAAAERVAQAESGEPEAKDFDNTEFIKVMREEYFKDVNTPENIALVDKMLVECDRKAIAAGMNIVPYVPPGPLPPDNPS